jgi:DNA-binding GntR family transcriptional regulator
MRVDPRADRAVYKQAADLIRDQIERGELAPGQRIPSEKDYVQQFGISRDSVSRAMGLLRNEGLITTGRLGSYVREQLKREAVRIAQGTISARMPTESERRQLDIDEGIPVLVVERLGQPDEFHPADRAVIEVGGN